MKLDIASARFVHDELLEHGADAVTTAARHVVPLDREEDWSDLLDSSRSWLNATLHVDTSGQPVISLRAGPRRPSADVDRRRRYRLP